MSSFESGTPLDKARADEGFSSFDQKVAASLEKPIVQILLLDAFKDYMVQYLALNQPPLSVSQLIGFSQFNAQFNVVRTGATESTASTSYTDLTTPGPELAGLSNGRYVLIYGGSAQSNAAGDTASFSPSINGAAASDDNFARTAQAGYVSIARAITATLSAGSNTVTMKYRTDAGTGFFSEVWLIALRYANL